MPKEAVQMLESYLMANSLADIEKMTKESQDRYSELRKKLMEALC